MVRLEIINQKIIVAAGQLGLTSEAQLIYFFPNLRKTSIQLVRNTSEDQKYGKMTPIVSE
jgi:hypothetical protein